MSELLDKAKLAAIAKLEHRGPKRDPKLLGTSFVVADRLLLTAKHVVKAFCGAAPPQGEILSVRLRDLKDPGKLVEGTGAVVAWGSTDALDWALVQCEEAKDRTPLRLRPLPFGVSQWRTFGYSRESGEYLGGELRGAPGAILDLEVRQLIDGASKTVAGASGSPVIAFGVVVGMLVEEVRTLDGKVNVNQAAKALASEAIVADAGKHLSLEAGELPFTAAFASELRKVPDAWKGLGKTLGVSQDGDPAESLARALVASGLIKIRQLLRSVPVAEILFKIAEALWVDDQAAKALHARIQNRKGPRAIGLDASTTETGRDYVLRAEGHSPDTPLFPTWHDEVLEFEVQLASKEMVGEPGESEEALLTRKLVACIYEESGPDKETDEDVNDWLETNGPLILLITSKAPLLPASLPAALAAVEERFPRVCALVLVGPGREPPESLELIEPRLAPFDEAGLRRKIGNYRKART